MKVLGFRHVGIPVKDIKAQTKFYKGLGFQVITSNDNDIQGLKTVKLKHPSSDVLVEFISGGSSIIKKNHIALTVDNVGEPSCFIRLIHTNPAVGIAKVGFIEDPEGNYIELVELEN